MTRKSPWPIEVVTSAAIAGELPARQVFEDYKFFTDEEFLRTSAGINGGSTSTPVTREAAAAATSTDRSLRVQKLKSMEASCRGSSAPVPP